MPAQNPKGKTQYYVEFDTAPPLRACLKDGDDNPIDLTGSEVLLNMAFAMPRGTYYTSPRDRIISAPCVVLDQTTNPGEVEFHPGTEVGVDAMSPPGQFLYQFQITYPDGSRQTVPPNTYLPLVIKTDVGGRAYNP